jgi:antitoxin (DNA-binding transcriptional repressor) of toxin-antitoxin stability system
MRRPSQRALAGEEVIIAKANRPLVRLVPIPQGRRFGSARGQVQISADFNAPLPEDLIRAFEGDHSL